MQSQKVNLLGLDEAGLKEYFISLGEKPYRARQLLKWIHKCGVRDFNLMTDISKNLRSHLLETATVCPPEIASDNVSSDGTRKWLMRLDSGSLVETVYIPERTRGTLCISSQVGCALNCTFCSTGAQGFSRNLTSDEIIGQLFKAEEILQTKVTNVVMMGMGEPLLNFAAVTKALAIMRHELAYDLPRRRVTLSTSGVVPQIDELKETSDVSLAVSLHAPNDNLRNILVPLNKKYPIKVLLDACKRYVKDNKRHHVTMEYVMLKDVNDSLENAKELSQILMSIPCKVNLIPFNTFPGTKYSCSPLSRIEAFRKVLTNHGIFTSKRATRGADIDAACGQLVGDFQDKTKRRIRHKLKTSNILPDLHGSEALNAAM